MTRRGKYKVRTTPKPIEEQEEPLGFMVPGLKSRVSETGMQIARTYREQVIELVEPKDLNRWFRALMSGVDVRDRTCMRLFAEMLKIVDSERDLVMVFVQQLGYNDPQQLTQMVEAMRLAEGLDEDGLAMRSERFLRDYYQRQGKRLVVLEDANGPAGPGGAATDRQPGVDGL